MSEVSNKSRNVTRKAVMLRAAEILELEGPGDLRIGTRGRPLILVTRKWSELVRELRRRAKGAWRGNKNSVGNLPRKKTERSNGERKAL